MEQEFIRWSVPHWAALIVIAAAAAAMLLSGLRMPQEGRYRLCRGLAVLILLVMALEYAWRAFSSDYPGPWQNNLPLHYCSIMAFISAWALWQRPSWACGQVYFSVLAASAQALITPALAADWPRAPFFFFFSSHGLLFLAALAVPVLLGWRARGYDDLRAVLIGDIYLAIVAPLNLWLGTNYGFTQAAPVQGSMLDLLGPAPWYYLWLQLPAWGIFRLLFLFVHDKTEE